MTDKRAGESGYVLVVIAAVLVILLGFAALAVDVGIMYAAHTAAQRAADAAALGGAYTFISNPNEPNPKTFAETTATNTAIQNTILGATIQSSELQPPPFADIPNRRVTVNITHTIPTLFAGVLGQKFATVSVVAYAEAGADPVGSSCLKPWFIPNNVLTTESDACKACTVDPKQLLMIKGEKEPTAWAQGIIDSQTGFTIKPGNPANALGPGNFYAIVLPNDLQSDTGGARYRDNIATCGAFSTMRCGDTYYVKPGNMIGPTSQGVSLFISFGITDKPNQIAPYQDTWSSLSPHFNGPASPLPPATGGSKTSSHQIALAPIWDVCSTLCADCLLTPPGPDCGKFPGNGSNAQAQIIGFAQIFISDIDPGGDVHAYLVSVSGCGSNPVPANESTVMGYPLRLVRMK